MLHKREQIHRGARKKRNALAKHLVSVRHYDQYVTCIVSVIVTILQGIIGPSPIILTSKPRLEEIKPFA